MNYFRHQRHGLTLIEMLVGMAITLVMMAAVVNLFANVSTSVSNRRAAIEINSTLRQARSQLKSDLAGATCPGSTWQTPEAGNGYIEIIEGQWSDSNPSALLDGDINGANGELDYTSSIIPSTQTIDTTTGNVTDGGGLGDHDDILALTVRSTDKPFRGTINGESEESQFAEVIWYAIENPASEELGEPGLRTIYRRVLLIADWVNPISGYGPDPTTFFQDNDISARFDPSIGLWVPNTLSDLTKREHRFMRRFNSAYPHDLATGGSGYGGSTIDLAGEIQPAGGAAAVAIVENESIISYRVTNGGSYERAPVITVPGGSTLATARPVMKLISRGSAAAGTVDLYSIAAIIHGPTPLIRHDNGRIGQDVMLNDALAFDVKVFDPGAPLVNNSNVVVTPDDFGWFAPTNLSDIVGYGAFVDLGWNRSYSWNPSLQPKSLFHQDRRTGWHPLDAEKNDPTANFGFPAVYDTWSLHYESDGVNQDPPDPMEAADPQWPSSTDQGTDGFDNNGLNGTDELGERETSPPYNVDLPAVKVRMRVYERDSRQIRETSVTESF